MDLWKRSAPRALLACAAVLAAGCSDGSKQQAEPAIEQESMWGIFWAAFSDELAGQPSDDDLKAAARFEQAGIAFEHPALLRVRSDDDVETPTWSLSRGDFELELHAPKGDVSADDYIGLLAEMAGGDDAIDYAEKTHPVDWCGRRIEATEVSFELFGDVHVFTGFDLPAPEGESRYLVFDDVLIGGQPSKVFTRTLEMMKTSVTCAEKDPPKDGQDG